jgi:hypothetical protein
MKIKLSPEVRAKLVAIAKKNEDASKEVGNVFALLKFINAKNSSSTNHWEKFKNEDTRIISRATLKGGVAIFRLHEEHTHCIALLVENDKNLHVLDFCSREDLSATEIRVIDTHTVPAD